MGWSLRRRRIKERHKDCQFQEGEMMLSLYFREKKNLGRGKGDYVKGKGGSYQKGEGKKTSLT